MTLALLFLLVAPLQDDIPKWIAQLESESLVEREEAARHLQSMGEAVVGRLEKSRDAAGSPEIRARIETVIAAIRKSAELAKVFGPTRRVTIAARGRPLKEVLAMLAAPGIATVDAGTLDPEARVDVQVRDGLWWEALDRTAKAAGGRYEISAGADGKYRVVLVPGREREGPVHYVEQFRICVMEIQRYERRTPAGKSESVVAVIEVRHQADLKPVDRSLAGAVRFKQVLDAKGEDARGECPEWQHSYVEPSRALSLQEVIWLRPDAKGPITFAGTAAMTFPRDTREIALDLEGAGARAQVGGVVIRVAGFSATSAGATMLIRAEGEASDLFTRLEDSAVSIVDAEGKRHQGSMRSGSHSDGWCAWSIEFTSGIKDPKKATFRWVAEYHKVELPFRLEGVRLPEAP